MKNRDNRNFAKNGFYHIYNRGNAKQNVFLDDEDRSFFLYRLKENLPRLAEGALLQGASLVAEPSGRYIRKTLPPGCFSLLSYCLMPNHFHFLIRQNTELSISKLIGKVFTSYSKYFNAKYDRVGHVFQDRFKAVLIETDSQLLWVSAYIHQNPKVAGLVEDLVNYKWSSYPDYLGLRNGTLCEKKFLLGMLAGVASYKQFVEDSYHLIHNRKEIEYLLLDE